MIQTTITAHIEWTPIGERGSWWMVREWGEKGLVRYRSIKAFTSDDAIRKFVLGRE